MKLFRSRNIQEIQPSPEMKLLLHCARTRLDEATVARIRELVSGEIDWPGLRALAHRHRVLPLLYWSLYKTCPELVPENALGHLRQDYQTNAAHNLMLTGELLKVLDALESVGIPAIAHKGPILAQTAYGDITLRQFNDLDVLIREEDLWAVRDLLPSVGFVPVPPFDRFSEQNYLSAEGECNFNLSGRDVFLEIHWHIITKPFSYLPEFDKLYRRQQCIELLGRRIVSLSYEDMLLMLCLHGTQDGWANLSAICDISELFECEPELDWETVDGQARRYDVQRTFNQGLVLARNVRGVELPVAVVQKMDADQSARSLASKIGEDLYRDDFTGRGFASRNWIKIRARQGFLNRLSYAMYLLLTPGMEDWSMIDLPSSLWFLYSIIRPVRMGFQSVLQVQKLTMSPNEPMKSGDTLI